MGRPMCGWILNLLSAIRLPVIRLPFSCDLHQKKEACRRNGVREYLAWIVEASRVAWWEPREGAFVELLPDADGFLKSGSFPGLWLDPVALLCGDLRQVFEVLRRGLESRQGG